MARGARKVARLLAARRGRFAGLIEAGLQPEPVEVNGYPALILKFDDEIDTVLAVRIDEGRITGLYAVRNPEKLARLEHATDLSR